MSKLTKTAGLLFMAAASVYLDQALFANSASAATPAPAAKAGATDVKLLDEKPVDPFAAAPTTEPTSQPTTQSTQGTSVSSTDVNVNDSGTVEIHVNDANLVEVLRMLSLQSQRNIIASKEVGGKVTANLYGVTVREALDAVLHANGYAYREKGNFIYVYTVKELAEIEKAERVANTEIFRLYYTPAANAVTMIKPVLSAEAQVSFTTPAANGIESGAKDVGGNSHAIEDVIVVSDYPDNLDRVRKILKEVDRRPQQILIEATVLRAALTDDNALGVDFTVLGGVDFAGISAAGSKVGDVLSGQVVNTAPGVADKGAGAANTGFTGQVPTGGLKVGVVTNNIAVFLSALEGVTNTTVLANPKVLALNKQKGEVIVGRKDGYLTTTVTESSSVQTVEFLDTGTRLIFRPYIGDDGFIRMEIHPEDSSGGLQGSANLPFKITTEVTSNVMVKDGHTIVIGGLFRESSTATRGQVPILGNLPFAGFLFRNTRDQTVREEIIILLTPHIVKDEVAYSQTSEEMLKEAEKYRVGVRKGMMWWGRERLAEGAYEKAMKERDKGHNSSATWWLNCATNLNPSFIEAIDAKEQLNGRVISTADNSSIRTFVRREMMNERINEPATEPVERSLRISNGPTTNPLGMAFAPTTNPSVALTASPTTEPTTKPSQFADADLPTTQPSVAMGEEPDADSLVGEVPSTQPSTQPSLAGTNGGNSNKSGSLLGTSEFLKQLDKRDGGNNAGTATASKGSTPSTQPSDTATASKGSSPSTQPSDGSTVTEVPMNDDNK